MRTVAQRNSPATDVHSLLSLRPGQSKTTDWPVTNRKPDTLKQAMEKLIASRSSCSFIVDERGFIQNNKERYTHHAKDRSAGCHPQNIWCLFQHLLSLPISPPLCLPTELFQPGDWEKVEEIKVATPAGAECRRCILPSIVCSPCYAPSAPSHGCSCSPPAAEACNGSRQKVHGAAVPPHHPEGAHHHEPSCTQKKPVKSNLKKAPPAAAQEGRSKVLVVSRKVSWPDAHGKDLAHVLEFHPSILEDGNLKGAARSCICVIL
uniref:Uncharacterized protein n=1 Tax=Oryza brachyantha TaxID=4533 RepID=J3MK73_ORYBR